MNTVGFVTTQTGRVVPAEKSDTGGVRMRSRFTTPGASTWIGVTTAKVRDSFRPACPRCGRDGLNSVEVRNALSRKDNETYVCNSCGTDEAMMNFDGGRDADVWPGFPGIALHYREGAEHAPRNP